jgi:hypothetical protein
VSDDAEIVRDALTSSRVRRVGDLAAFDRILAVVEAAKEYERASEAWFPTLNARPFDAEASARASLVRQDAYAALRAALSRNTKGETP